MDQIRVTTIIMEVHQVLKVAPVTVIPKNEIATWASQCQDK